MPPYRPLRRGTSAYWRFRAGRAWNCGRVMDAQRYEELAASALAVERDGKQTLGESGTLWSKFIGWSRGRSRHTSRAALVTDGRARRPGVGD